MKHWLLFVLLGVGSTLYAQNGSISGKVVDATRGEDMIGALVQIESLKMGAATDFDGTYTIKNIPAGTYQVKVSFISYTTKVISDVVVKANAVTELNISMQEMVIESEAVEIVDFKRTDTEASALIEMKEAKGVVTAVSNAQIAKSQDRDASEVARRIPGVTVVDNRFVVVRGLSERYNAVSLNNALVPSFEADVKSFAFDVIPSQMIDRFLIYKSPSPDLQGEFAGGAINIFTKTMPENDLMLNVDLGTAFRTGTTFEDFRNNTGGLKELPSDFPTNVRDVTDATQLQALGRSLPNSWGYTTDNAGLDRRVNAMFGKKFSIGDQVVLGTTTAINYSNTSVAFLSERSDYNVFDELLQQSDTIFHYKDSIFQRQSRLGVMHNWGLRIGRKHQIEFRNLLNSTSMQENTFRTGVNYEEGSYRREYAYRLNQRFIYSGQLNGSHDVFGKNGKVEWDFGYAVTVRNDPDWRRIRYTLPLDGSQEQWTAYIPFSAQPFYLGRLFIELNETKWMSSASYEHKLKETGTDLKGEKQFLSLKGGYYLEQKNRDFSIRNIGYAPSSFATFGNLDLATAPVDQILSEQYINTTDGLKLDEDTKPADSYTAANRLVAGYVMVNAPYKKWNLSGGLRAESNRQTLSSFTIQNDPLDIIQDTLLLLPSANLSYNINEKSLIRAAFGKTVNRPEFREMAPYYFYDFVFNSIYSGNSSIKFATANNYDFRWEYYPRPTELISAGVFYKQFTNPIEMYFLTGAGGGGTRSFIPGNANEATSYGLEVDIRKSLAETFKNKVLNKFSVVANFSLIKSDVKLDESDANTGVANNRPMMGQSPYVVNLGLYYQNEEKGWSMSALYNVVGPRIVIVGIPGIPEVFEMPRNLVDLSVTKSLGTHWSVRFGVQDLLNQKFALVQDANGDGKLNRETDQVMQSYRRGTYYSLSIRYQFKK